MIEMYNRTNEFCDSSESDILFELNARVVSNAIGNKVMSKKVRIKCTRNCFTVRAAYDWNNLPEEVTSSPSLNIFKRRLNRHWADSIQSFEMWNGTMELIPEATPVDQKT